MGELAFARETFDLVKVKSLSDEKLSEGLSFLFTRISNLLGIKDPIQQNNKSDIKEMILMRFKSLSLEEIDYAFKLERYGAYEEKTEHFQLFNAEYVGAVLNKYRKWLQKTRHENNISSLKNEPQELSSEEKKLIVINGIINCFEFFKENNRIKEGTLYVYDVLYPLGAFPNHNRKFKEKVRRKAIKKIYKEKNKAKSLLKNRQISAVLKGVKNGSDNLVLKCKELILVQFFSKIITTEQDFTEVLSELFKRKKNENSNTSPD